MKFWDASAIVPLLVDEPESRAVGQLASQDPELLVWWATEVECASALARVEREQGEPPEASLRELAQVGRMWTVVVPDEKVKAAALRLLRGHSLRAADALQLAAALVAGGHQPAALGFVCLDERLRRAAEKEGFLVLPE